MTVAHGYAAQQERGEFHPIEYDLGELGPEQVELKVHSCGICHSDLSMLDNEWGMSQYPLVPGHEIVGEVTAFGSSVKGLALGEMVGLGWFSGSCMSCDQCMGGMHNLCANSESTIVGRHGGFADTVRCHYSWAVPLPPQLDRTSAGPLFCGGITVFGPIDHFGVKPTDRVGVVGIGGLGHLAVQFLNKWGCHVTAFTSSDSKADSAREFGAHEVINSRDERALRKAAGSFDFILSTVNVTLDWNAYLSTLAPNGRFHTVGAVLEPMQIPAFSLIGGQKSVSGSPLGAPATLRRMLDFCGRHEIKPLVETFGMDKVNEAVEHLRSGKARFRVVLENAV